MRKRGVREKVSMNDVMVGWDREREREQDREPQMKISTAKLGICFHFSYRNMVKLNVLPNLSHTFNCLTLKNVK